MMEKIGKFAVKYEMPKVSACLRGAIKNDDSPYDSLDMYVLACRFGWKEEAIAASQGTLVLDLRSHSVRSRLQALDGKSLLLLLDLHQTRAESLLETLDTLYRSYHHFDCQFRHLYVPEMSDKHWVYLKYIIFLEMQCCSAGYRLEHPDFWDRDCFASIWRSQCRDCEIDLPTKEETQEAVMNALKSLPTTITYL